MNFFSSGPVRPNLPFHLMDEGERAANLVEKSTSDILLAVDWSMNMEVVDALNRTRHQEIRREIIRQIRKRLQSRTTRVVLMALSLIETVVKNCGPEVHYEVATPKFMASMARVARAYHEKMGKENLQVAELALDLIQSWGEVFLPMASTVPLFSRTYHELKREGLPFRKQYDESKVPVLTPPASTRIGSSPQPDALAASSQGPTAHSDLLKSVDVSVGMLRDIMHEAALPEDLSKNEIYSEVLGQCKTLVGSLQQAIEGRVMEGREDVQEYLKANDDLQATLQLHESIRDGSVTLPLPGRETRKPQMEEPLIAFDDFVSSSVDATLGSNPAGVFSFSSTAEAEKGKNLASPGVSATSTLQSSSLPPSTTPQTAPEPVIPKLPPSRRESFGRHPAGRRRSRGSGGEGDLLDLSSLDITEGPGTPGPALSSTGSGFQPMSSLDFSSALPNPRRTSLDSFHEHTLPSSTKTSHDPFTDGPIPHLPPPRSFDSPSPNPHRDNGPALPSHTDARLNNNPAMRRTSFEAAAGGANTSAWNLDGPTNLSSRPDSQGEGIGGQGGRTDRPLSAAGDTGSLGALPLFTSVPQPESQHSQKTTKAHVPPYLYTAQPNLSPSLPSHQSKPLQPPNTTFYSVQPTSPRPFLPHPSGHQPNIAPAFSTHGPQPIPAPSTAPVWAQTFDNQSQGQHAHRGGQTQIHSGFSSPASLQNQQQPHPQEQQQNPFDAFPF